LQLRIAEDIVRFANKKKVEDEIAFLKKSFSPSFDVATLDKVSQEVQLAEKKNADRTNLNLYYRLH
jgi:hypothetical protein